MKRCESGFLLRRNYTSLNRNFGVICGSYKVPPPNGQQALTGEVGEQ